jgi:hypothetical protein
MANSSKWDACASPSLTLDVRNGTVENGGYSDLVKKCAGRCFLNFPKQLSAAFDYHFLALPQNGSHEHRVLNLRAAQLVQNAVRATLIIKAAKKR